MVRGKYKYKSILKMFFVIILSCIMAVTMNNAAMAVVIDVSGHDGLIDWDSAKAVSYTHLTLPTILRV